MADQVIVKHKTGGCLSCLIILLVIFVGLPIIAFTMKIAFLMALVQAAMKAFGIHL